MSFAASSRLRLFLGPYLAWSFRVALGAVFIVAALPKISDPDGFARSIAHYHLLPDAAINLLAICLPWVELLSGVGAILGVATRANLLLIGAMLATFIVAIGTAMWRDLDISCGCFSTGDASAGAMTRWTLYWDMIWLAMSLHAIRYDRDLLALSRLWRRARC